MVKASSVKTRYRLALGVAGLMLLASVGMLVWQLRHPYVIVEDSAGFHPKTLTIHAGQTVEFKSVRGKYFWPASDFHPTHLLHPKFDPKQPIAPSASWSYTFTDAGIYPFHDHLAAYYMGIITVLDAHGQVVNDCMHGGKFSCWQQQLFASLAQGGPNAAFDTMQQLYARDPSFADSCHYLAHNLGLATYQFYVKDPSVVLSPKAMYCAGGFYHGFMEGYLGATGNVAGAAQICDTIGKALSAQSPDARLQCYHGIGHGAIETEVATTGTFDSLSQSVDLALGICEKASAGADERYRCVSGLYNAIANFYIAGEYGLSVKTTDPYALCARQKDVYKEACYGNMNSIAYWEGNNDLAKAAPYVLAIPDAQYRGAGIQYLAGLASLSYVGTSTPFAPAVADCRGMGAYRLDCIKGLAHGLLEHGQPGSAYVRALAFCGDAALTADEAAACYQETLGQLSGWYSAAESAHICALAPAMAQRYCSATQST